MEKERLYQSFSIFRNANAGWRGPLYNIVFRCGRLHVWIQAALLKGECKTSNWHNHLDYILLSLLPCLSWGLFKQWLIHTLTHSRTFLVCFFWVLWSIFLKTFDWNGQTVVLSDDATEESDIPGNLAVCCVGKLVWQLRRKLLTSDKALNCSTALWSSNQWSISRLFAPET